MSKIKVGDKVRVVRELTNDLTGGLELLGVSVGDVGEVVEFDSRYEMRPWIVVIDGCTHPVGFNTAELEVVTDGR